MFINFVGNLKLRLLDMNIICNSGHIGVDFFAHMSSAIQSIKKAEKELLKLANQYPELNYDKYHELLVKKRKSLSDIEEIKELIK